MKKTVRIIALVMAVLFLLAVAYTLIAVLFAG